jgi:hypothetical protein
MLYHNSLLVVLHFIFVLGYSFTTNVWSKIPNWILHKDLIGNSFKEKIYLLKASKYITWPIISKLLNVMALHSLFWVKNFVTVNIA